MRMYVHTYVEQCKCSTGWSACSESITAYLSVLLSTALAKIDLDGCSLDRKHYAQKWVGLRSVADKTMHARMWHRLHRLYCAMNLYFTSVIEASRTSECISGARLDAY